MVTLCPLIPISIGFIIALFVYIPPVQTLARCSATFKLLLAFTLGLISFILLYGIQTYNTAHGTYHMGDMRYECQSCDHMIYVTPELTQEEHEYKQAIIVEYWSRELLPPAFQSACNTKHPTVCRLAEDINAHNFNRHQSPTTHEKVEWNTFFLYFASSTCGTVSTIFFVARFTRRDDVHSRIPLL
jgi:hypothetical protein